MSDVFISAVAVFSGQRSTKSDVMMPTGEISNIKSQEQLVHRSNSCCCYRTFTVDLFCLNHRQGLPRTHLSASRLAAKQQEAGYLLKPVASGEALDWPVSHSS